MALQVIQNTRRQKGCAPVLNYLNYLRYDRIIIDILLMPHDYEPLNMEVYENPNGSTFVHSYQPCHRVDVHEILIGLSPTI